MISASRFVRIVCSSTSYACMCSHTNTHTGSHILLQTYLLTLMCLDRYTYRHLRIQKTHIQSDTAVHIHATQTCTAHTLMHPCCLDMVCAVRHSDVHTYMDINTCKNIHIHTSEHTGIHTLIHIDICRIFSMPGALFLQLLKSHACSFLKTSTHTLLPIWFIFLLSVFWVTFMYSSCTGWTVTSFWHLL